MVGVITDTLQTLVFHRNSLLSFQNLIYSLLRKFLNRYIAFFNLHNIRIKRLFLINSLIFFRFSYLRLPTIPTFKVSCPIYNAPYHKIHKIYKHYQVLLDTLYQFYDFLLNQISIHEIREMPSLFY